MIIFSVFFCIILRPLHRFRSCTTRLSHHMDNLEEWDGVARNGGDGVPPVFSPYSNEMFTRHWFKKGMEGASAPSAASFHLLGLDMAFDLALDSFNQGAASRAMLVPLLLLRDYVLLLRDYVASCCVIMLLHGMLLY